MKVSLNWLTDYVNLGSHSAQQIADVLTRIGLVCDAIDETDADVVFDLDVTSNRPDCLGHVGIARELATALGLPLSQPDLSGLKAAKPTAAELTSVQVLDADLCPRYTARVIRGVRVGPSPAWMVDRLQAVGLRSVNNIVDVTNYVMLEYSQPLHSFDMDRLSEGRIVVRRAKAGEQIVSIDGSRCELNPAMLVIADAAHPVAVAGIMGGLESEIGDKTVNVLLESARFDPMSIRQTSRNLGLLSDSSYRFERGVDPVGVEIASRRACQLILQLAGGQLADHVPTKRGAIGATFQLPPQLAEGVVDVWATPFAPAKVALRPERTNKILGIDVPAERQLELLQSLGLSPVMDAGKIVCTIPSHRADLSREIDLIEEVCRLHGLDKIPLYDRLTHRVVGPSRQEVLRGRLRRAMESSGFDEAMTFTFCDPAEAGLFGFAQPICVDERVRKTNNVLRPTLLCSLLRVAKNNQDVGNTDVNLYEIASVFPPKPHATADDLPDEYTGLAILSQRSATHIRGALDSALAQLSPTARLDVTPAEIAGLAEGAAANFTIDGKPAGHIGMISQAALDYYGLEQPCSAAMVRLEPLLAVAEMSWKYRPLPKFPPIRRDLSLLLDEAVTWKELSETIRALNQPELEELDYVGTYRGKQVPPGKKSLTLTLTYRSATETLRHEQADAFVAQVLAAAQKRLAAELRA